MKNLLVLLFIIIISLPTLSNEYDDTINDVVQFKKRINQEQQPKSDINYNDAISDVNNNRMREDITNNKHDLYYAENYYMRAKSCLHNGKYQDAIAYFDKAIKYGLDNEDIRYDVALAKGGLKDYKGAIDDCKQILAKNPNSKAKELLDAIKQEYTKLANYSYWQKDYLNAIKYYTGAISIYNNDFNLYNLRGSAKCELKDYTGAIEDYTTAIKLNPNISYLYSNRANAYYYQTNYNKAIIDYEKAIELDPSSKINENLENAKQALKKQQIASMNYSQNSNNKKIETNNIGFGSGFIYFLINIAITAIMVIFIDFIGSIYTKLFLCSKEENPFDNSIYSKIDNVLNPEDAAKRERQYRKEQFWKQYWFDISKNGWNFEKAVGELYRRLGYKVTVTQGTGDGGVDLILKKDREKIIVQCKAHKHQVGPEPVRALWGVREDFGANSAIFVAYSGVTQGVWDFIKGKRLRIVDVNELIQLSIQVHSEKVNL